MTSLPLEVGERPVKGVLAVQDLAKNLFQVSALLLERLEREEWATGSGGGCWRSVVAILLAGGIEGATIHNGNNS